MSYPNWIKNFFTKDELRTLREISDDPEFLKNAGYVIFFLQPVVQSHSHKVYPKVVRRQMKSLHNLLLRMSPYTKEILNIRLISSFDYEFLGRLISVPLEPSKEDFNFEFDLIGRLEEISDKNFFGHSRHKSPRDYIITRTISLFLSFDLEMDYAEFGTLRKFLTLIVDRFKLGYGFDVDTLIEDIRAYNS